MITVKAFKPASKPSQPTRNDYVEDAQEKGRLIPVAFLLFLTACAAYLKSFLPVTPKAEAALPDGKHEDAEPGVPLPEDISAAATGAEPQNDDEPSSSGKVIPIRPAQPQQVSDFLASDSQPLDFSRMLPRPVLAPAASFPLAELVRAGNDNRMPDTFANAGGGGGGGGGGGNGRGVEGNSEPGKGAGAGDNHANQPGPEKAGDTSTDPSRNRSPRTNGPVYLPDVIACQTVVVSSLLLLTGATDPDGDTLRITDVSSSSGSLTQTEDGGWVFEREPGMLGDVTLTYTIGDGLASIQQTAHFSVVPVPPVIGTGRDDNLLGTHCADTIEAGAGDDNIHSRGGDDIIFGGAGDDHIVAGAGHDIVYAGEGNDLVFGGAGNDIIFAGAGDDRIYGEDGNDRILGGAGDDILIAGTGNDIVQGDEGNDVLHGEDGNDTVLAGSGDDVVLAGAGDDHVEGEAGDDTIFGEDGNDVLSDGVGEDVVDGGAGDDHVVAAADAQDDVYSGGDGEDTLDYSTATLSISVDLGQGTANGLDIGHDLIAAFEEVLGGVGDDRITAGSTSVAMTGGKGNDTFVFQRLDSDDLSELVVRKITDFTVGDRIVAATFEISSLQAEDADENIADMFEDIYLSAEGGERPVRFHFEKVEEDERTLINVHDRPDTDDFYTIEIAGYHQFQFAVLVA